MKQRILNIICYILLILLVFIFLGPFIWNFLTSVKLDAEIYSPTIKILPSTVTFTHYLKLFTKMGDFFAYFYNTVGITFWSLIFIVLLSTTSGYAFGSLGFKGQTVFLGFVLVVLTLPYAIYLIPIYIMQDKMEIINTHWALILPYAAVNLPMSILIMRGHFKSVPRELEEAAIIDGCGYFKAWYKIMMPIVKPGVAVVAILGFINVWGEYLFARTLTHTPDAQTLSVGITFLRDEAASWQFGTLTSAITISLIPPLIIFLTMQKYFVKGIIEGALKG